MTRWKNTFNKNAALIYDGFRCQVRTERPAVQTPHHPDPLYLINITQIQLHRACPYYEYKAARVQSFSILLRNNYV